RTRRSSARVLPLWAVVVMVSPECQWGGLHTARCSPVQYSTREEGSSWNKILNDRYGMILWHTVRAITSRVKVLPKHFYSIVPCCRRTSVIRVSDVTVRLQCSGIHLYRKGVANAARWTLMENTK